MLVPIALAVLVAGDAWAQCDFVAAGKARSLRTDMIRAFAPCPSTTFPLPNESTSHHVPSCAPPVTLSPYRFDPNNGRCSVKVKSKREVPCSDGTGYACHNTFVAASCRGILEPSGMSGVDGDGWSLYTVSRATINDRTGGDMTVVDFPARFDFRPASHGKMKLSSDANTVLIELLGAGTALPSCTAIEVLSLRVIDPQGGVFATMGNATRP